MAFNDGDVAVAANYLILKIDINKDGMPLTMCVNTFNESANLTTETWTDICGGGISSTAVTGSDIEWSVESVVKKGDNLGVYATVKKRYDIESLQNIPMTIENEFLNEKVELDVTISSLEITHVANELMKANMTFKPFGGQPTVTELTPAP